MWRPPMNCPCGVGIYIENPTYKWSWILYMFWGKVTPYKTPTQSGRNVMGWYVMRCKCYDLVSDWIGVFIYLMCTQDNIAYPQYTYVPMFSFMYCLNLSALNRILSALNMPIKSRIKLGLSTQLAQHIFSFIASAINI